MNKNGFTLLEVMVALLVVSLGFMGFIMSLSSTAENYRRLENKALATLVASNLMSKINIGLVNLKTNNAYAEEDMMANKLWKCQVQINKNSESDLLEIEVVVKNENNEKVHTLQGFHSNYAKQ